MKSGIVCIILEVSSQSVNIVSSAGFTAFRLSLEIPSATSVQKTYVLNKQEN